MTKPVKDKKPAAAGAVKKSPVAMKAAAASKKAIKEGVDERKVDKGVTQLQEVAADAGKKVVSVKLAPLKNAKPAAKAAPKAAADPKPIKTPAAVKKEFSKALDEALPKALEEKPELIPEVKKALMDKIENVPAKAPTKAAPANTGKPASIAGKPVSGSLGVSVHHKALTAALHPAVTEAPAAVRQPASRAELKPVVRPPAPVDGRSTPRAGKTVTMSELLSKANPSNPVAGAGKPSAPVKGSLRMSELLSKATIRRR